MKKENILDLSKTSLKLIEEDTIDFKITHVCV